MWIFLNNAMLSIVEHNELPGFLHVRARLKGDIERVFPGERVIETPKADYRFRATINSSHVKRAMANAVDDIDYTNFKGSVKDHDRHDYYMDVWSAGMAAQARSSSKRASKRARASS
jgi:hypothetical protein